MVGGGSEANGGTECWFEIRRIDIALYVTVFVWVVRRFRTNKTVQLDLPGTYLERAMVPLEPLQRGFSS